MTQFSAKVQKPYFCPFLGPFCPKSREREFFQIWDLRRKLANHKTLHFSPFLAKTNDSILHKSPKTLFFALFQAWVCVYMKLEDICRKEDFVKEGKSKREQKWAGQMEKNQLFCILLKIESLVFAGNYLKWSVIWLTFCANPKSGKILVLEI